ncbi:MAG TPA: peptide ABC transporter substrate-binding protein [Rectinemataceae bacterium]|nr:peptide ABC transporter substrate-binding protein [Rectinemataceae bacterium]
MKKLFVPILVTLALLSVAQAGAADRKSGDYVEAYAGELTTLNYLVSGSQNEHYMFANMLDGLVECDRFGILRPSLAKSWTVSPDGLVWTFSLRPGVKWLTWQGKEYDEVVAQDWVDAAKYIMTKTNASGTADVIYGVLKNGEQYWEGKVTDFSQVGVKAKDKYTVEYTLSRPVPYFLSMLTYVCFLPANGRFMAEMGAKWGTDNKSVLYNGAYIMTSYEPQSSRELLRNEKYWDRANVFIKRLTFKYNKESDTLAPELFLRNEVSFAPIPSTIIDTWMKDSGRSAKIHPARMTSYSYFYALNFKPTFDAQYEPANWKVVVNNKAFRQSLFFGLDRQAAMLTSEPYNPARRLQNTITPRGFANAGGKDYVDIGGLAAISKTESFNKAQALKFKAQAMKELAGKATFPVKVLMPFRADMADWASRAQVVQQQLETLLGKDYLTVIPVAFPATGFLGATRRAGNYAIQECNWGPDYADPETYTDPFVTGSNYNWPELAEGYGTADRPKYESLVDAAKAETANMAKRFELFAKAETYLINEAMVIPYARGISNMVAYEASKLEPFTCPFAPFGLSELKFKGQIVLDKPLGTAEYQKLEAQWLKEKAAALTKVK